MSLRARLIASMGFVLAASLAAGGFLASWHAARSVRIEVLAALAVSERTARSALDELPGSSDASTELGRLVHAFDGDRHVRAMLLDPEGQPVATSRVAKPPQAIPPWFVRLVAPSLPTVSVPVRQKGRAASELLLQADPVNEASEAWTQLRDGLAVVALLCMSTALLVCFVVGRAVRPLERVSAALAAVGSGRYAVRVPRSGPPELARLAGGFNAMAERLEAAEAQNRRLHARLLTLQAEERSELARDLHDEVGSFLFAVGLDVAAIEQGAAAGRLADVAERAGAIRDAVGHMQRHVRTMLRRLRPASPVAIGLAPALGNLLAFWRARRPGIALVLAVAAEADEWSEPVKAVSYRVVQEALSNAVRHADASRIEVHVCAGEEGAAIVRVADNGAGFAREGGSGFGLAGMRERVAGLGGTLRLAGPTEGTGVVVTAWLPSAEEDAAPAGYAAAA